MKCAFCGGEVEKRHVTFTYDEDGKYFIIENVPAEVCVKCGEKTYSTEITDELLRMAREKASPVRKTEPLYEFTVNQ
ncbi:MAG: type II toxin-antitoxin system MqsA family antitoxin [Deltaproteobacteria bacterium]|nr:type II toxin-antitoxin system MqsA family antitoxin [Deltaproteobacteria bacterium]